MSRFWWGKAKAVQAFSTFDEANPWFLKQGINSDSVTFDTYNEPSLARNPGAIVLAGVGKDDQGNRVGFALEVVSGKGVVASEILVPDGIATWHKKASMLAKASGQPLLDMLVAMAASHRACLDDADAAITLPKFLAAMDLIESLPSLSQEVIAFGVERVLMKDIAEHFRKYLPEHCHQDKDYLQFVDSKDLKLFAEHYFSEARSHKVSVDSTPIGAGVAGLELVGYYLLSRSWQDFDHTINIDAPGLGATMIGMKIETRIHAFLKKQGRSLPRLC